jgi:methionine aminopeptidase
MKIYYGIHYSGCIVDSAFSIIHSSELEKLIDISKLATKEAIKMSGGYIGSLIYEIITSDIFIAFCYNERVKEE